VINGGSAGHMKGTKMTEKLIRFPKVREKTGKSRTSIWRDERAGLFPRRRRVGANSVAWLESEVDAWITTRVVVVRDSTSLYGEKEVKGSTQTLCSEKSISTFANCQTRSEDAAK